MPKTKSYFWIKCASCIGNDFGGFKNNWPSLRFEMNRNCHQIYVYCRSASFFCLIWVIDAYICSGKLLCLWTLLLIKQSCVQLQSSQALNWRKSRENRCLIATVIGINKHTHAHTRSRFSPKTHSTSDRICTWHWIHRITNIHERQYGLPPKYKIHKHKTIYQTTEYERVVDKTYTKTWVTICCSLHENVYAGSEHE